MKEEFYTDKRWLNWLGKVKDSKFTLNDSDEKGAGAVFVYIMDDVVLACLKVIARCERKVLSPDEALVELDNIRKIVFSDHESLGEDADLMLDSLKTSLAAVFASSQRYIAGDFDHESDLKQMVKKAMEAENQENVEEAFSILSQIGARVISGESLSEDTTADMPYSMTAELLDGIDAISAAMIGDDSYKEDDGTEECSEDV
jgi:hypothetical protein